MLEEMGRAFLPSQNKYNILTNLRNNNKNINFFFLSKLLSKINKNKNLKIKIKFNE